MGGRLGADAAPYFRVFNPILQGEKFDPDGVYVEQVWVPELAPLPDELLHQPWTATPLNSQAPASRSARPIRVRSSITRRAANAR